MRILKIIFLSFILIFSVLFLYSCNYNNKTILDTNPLYAKIQTNERINILINGDSVANDPSNSSWQIQVAQKLKNEYSLDEVYMSNISLSGNGSFGGYVIENLTALADNESYDLIILCYSQNDYDRTNFALYYESLIRSTIKNNPDAQIITVLESSQGEYTENIEEIIQISEYYGIPYVDMIKAFVNSQYSIEELTTDLIHLNEIGHTIYAENIVEVLKKQVFCDNYIKKKISSSLNKDTKNFENFYYINREKMKVENNQLEFSFDGNYYCLGLDQTYIPGNNNLSIQLNDDVVDLSYYWNQSFNQRHISRIKYEGSESKKNTSVIIKGDKEILDNIKGVIIISAKKLGIEFSKQIVKLQRIEAKSIEISKVFNQTILDSEKKLKQVSNGYLDASNYYVAIYPVESGQYLEISSKTIGTVNTITRYAFFEDNLGEHLIKSGGYNTGGWKDKYVSKVLVPEDANYLFVTSQNNSDIIVRYNVDKSIEEELPFDKVYTNKIISAEGHLCGIDTNPDYANYTVYLYEVKNVGRVEIQTNAIGNPNTFMIFALSDKRDVVDFEINGQLNSQGWKDTSKISVKIGEEYKYLYVLCQNSQVPVVTMVN